MSQFFQALQWERALELLAEMRDRAWSRFLKVVKEVPGTPRPTIYKWMEMVISNHLPCKDLASSNWNNYKKTGRLEFQVVVGIILKNRWNGEHVVWFQLCIAMVEYQRVHHPQKNHTIPKTNGWTLKMMFWTKGISFQIWRVLVSMLVFGGAYVYFRCLKGEDWWGVKNMPWNSGERTIFCVKKTQEEERGGTHTHMYMHIYICSELNLMMFAGWFCWCPCQSRCLSDSYLWSGIPFSSPMFFSSSWRWFAREIVKSPIGDFKVLMNKLQPFLSFQRCQPKKTWWYTMAELLCVDFFQVKTQPRPSNGLSECWLKIPAPCWDFICLELQGQPFINGWKWWFPTISYVKIGFIIQLMANHKKNWLLFGVPGGCTVFFFFISDF